jgi:acetyltransferase-like isoleucine patch superfamily enzyme
MDISGTLNKQLFNLSQLTLRFIYTPLNLIIALLFGLKVHKSSRFIGRTKFIRRPHSSIDIGKNCEFLSRDTSNLIGINHRCILSTLTVYAKITIGNNCGFSGCIIGAAKSIKLGNNVRCGANTVIIDSDWHFDDARIGPPKEVIINDNVWLGINVVVLKGVTIGENSIIGANSVVTKDVPPNVIAAGNPCKMIRKLDNNI